MKKVLFVASTEIHIRHFHMPYIERFKKLGWQVHVACKCNSESIPEVDKLINLPFEKKMTSLRNFKATALLHEQIKKNNYDLMLCHTSLAAFFSRLAVLGLRRRPAVCNMVHGYLFDDDSSMIKKLVMTAAEKITAPVTELILAMNKYDFDYAKKHKLAKQVGYVNGIGLDESKCEACEENLRKKFGFSENSYLVLYAAEFSKRKNQKLLINALSKLPMQVCLILPGDGEFLGECKTLAEKLGLAERVCFPGYVKGVGKWYSTVDAAVSSSRSEGLPFNILEAMYYGLPVVASAVKGHTDLIEDGMSGLLAPFDDAEKFAEKINLLIENPELAKNLACNAKAKSEEFLLETVKEKVMHLYLTIV